MTGKTRLPRLTSTSEGGCVEVADGVFIRWRCDANGKWQVSIEAADLDVLGIHHEKAAATAH
jgi:hypothetical protein